MVVLMLPGFLSTNDRTYRLEKKYSRYTHIGSPGRKNCCVMGMRSRIAETATAPVLMSGADGRMQSEKKANPKRRTYWRSKMRHVRVFRASMLSSGLKDVWSRVTLSPICAPGFDLIFCNRGSFLPDRYLEGIGLNWASLRTVGQAKGSCLTFGWVKTVTKSCMANSHGVAALRSAGAGGAEGGVSGRAEFWESTPLKKEEKEYRSSDPAVLSTIHTHVRWCLLN